MSLVSILLPYYKKERYIGQTIKSILNQTYKNFELIIIFDEPFKKTHPIYEKIIKLKKKDKRIKLILNNKNLGVSKSRNKGIKLAKGKYIAFIDADDFWSKKKLSFQVNYMRRKKLLFTHTNYYIINENNKITGLFKAKKNLYYSDLINSCDIGLSTVIINRKILKFVKFPNIRTKEDYVVWLRLAKKNIELISIGVPFTFWRQTKDSLSSSFTQKLVDAYKVYHVYEKKNFLKSIFHIIILCSNFIVKKIKIIIIK